MKSFSAILFATLMAVVLIASVFLMGENAIQNNNQAPVLNSPASAPAPTSVAAVDQQQQQQIDQLVRQQQLVNQYQAREQQYQAELKQAADRLNQSNQQLAQANQTVKMYQQLVQQLQQAGLIAITQDGRVLIQ